MKNENKTPHSKEDILAGSNQGRDFFKIVFEGTGQKLKGGNTGGLRNPFYKDSKGSVSIYKKGNLWYFTDHGDNHYSGDVFTFAGFHFGLNPQTEFPKILEKMAGVLNIPENISNGMDQPPKHKNQVTKQPLKDGSLPLDYWFQYGPKDAILKALDSFRVSHPEYFLINGSKIRNEPGNPGFLMQVQKGIQAFKVYRPCAKPKHLWINKPEGFSNVYGLDSLPPEGSLLLITEGPKDAISARANGFTAIALDNANTNLPNVIAKELRGKFEEIILCLDNDPSGIKAMEREGRRHGFPFLILPGEIKGKEFKGKDLSDFFKEGFKPDELKTLLVENLKSVRKEDEPNFKPNEEGFQSVLPFPINVFPPGISKFILESKATLGHIEDYLGAGILFAFSVASGNKFSIELKKTWIETPIFYLAIIGRSGIGKTSPLKLATGPIIKKDQYNWNRYQSEKRAFIEWEKLPIDEKQTRPEIAKPILKKCFVSDITPEKLCNVLDQNPNGLGYFADEFAAWFKNFGRYSKGGSESEFWIKTWSRDPIIIDRKTSDPIRIENPFISVCGGIQPGIIGQLANEGRNENGFLERILFFWPDNLFKQPWPKQDLKEELFAQYERAIQKVIESPGRKFSFSLEAKALLFEWQALHVKECNLNEEEELLGFYSKFETYLIRFSLLFHLMEWAMSNISQPEEQIKKNAIEASIQLIEYFKSTAKKVHKYISGNQGLKGLPERKRMFYESLPLQFKRKDILELANQYQIKTRTLDRFLSDSKFFTLIETGCYKRRFN